MSKSAVYCNTCLKQIGIGHCPEEVSSLKNAHGRLVGDPDISYNICQVTDETGKYFLVELNHKEGGSPMLF